MQAQEVASSLSAARKKCCMQVGVLSLRHPSLQQLCASARCAASLACKLHSSVPVLSAHALALLSLLPADCLLILSLLLQRVHPVHADHTETSTA